MDRVRGGSLATIYDVARVAGVSAKTVGRVLNGDAPVGPAMRANVERAMDELGYVPSSAARMLRSNRSRLIGVVSGAIADSCQELEAAGLPETHILRGIQDVADDTGHTMLVSDTGGDPGRAGALIRTFTEHRVDGIVVVASYHRKVELDAGRRTPVVIANGYDDRGTPSVVPGDYTGQRDLVRRIVASGHRRIAYFQLPPGLDATRHRTRVYRDALTEAALPFDPEIVRPADVTRGEGSVRNAALARAVAALLDLPDPPTAICCGTDRMAIAVYGLLRMRGLSIPGDISVAGYDDHRLISEMLFPQLTTVELPCRAIGRRAAELLLAAGEPGTGAPIEIGGAVRWRESVAPPRT